MRSSERRPEPVEGCGVERRHQPSASGHRSEGNAGRRGPPHRCTDCGAKARAELRVPRSPWTVVLVALRGDETPESSLSETCTVEGDRGTRGGERSTGSGIHSHRVSTVPAPARYRSRRSHASCRLGSMLEGVAHGGLLLTTEARRATRLCDPAPPPRAASVASSIVEIPW